MILKLTRDNFWEEIANQVLPPLVIGVLLGAVNTYLNDSVWPIVSQKDYKNEYKGVLGELKNIEQIVLDGKHLRLVIQGTDNYFRLGLEEIKRKEG